MTTGTTPAAGTPAPTRKTPVNGGRSYVMTDEQHQLRMFCAFACWTVGVLIVFALSMFFFRSNYYYGAFVGLALGVLVVTESIARKMFVVAVPTATGLILVNPWVGATPADPYANQLVCSVGMSFKFPWEEAVDGLFIDLRLAEQGFEEDFPALDGIVIKTKGGFSYRPMLELLPRYVAVSDTTIKSTLVRITTAKLSDSISHMESKDAREALPQFQKDLIAVFDDPGSAMQMTDQGEARLLRGMELDATFEHLFGISFEHAQIADADYTPSYRDILERRRRAKLVTDAIEELLKTPDLSPADKAEATNNILVQFGIITKRVDKVEGNMAEAVATIIARWAGIGNP